MERISGDFVRSLRNEIKDRKKVKNYERSLLQDSLNYILEIFQDSKEIELRSVKNFETHELSCIANLYTEKEDILETLVSHISKKIPDCTFKKLDSKLIIFVLDLKGKLSGYRNKKNQVVLQFQIKGKHTFEMKLFLKNSDLLFSIYEKSYHSFKVWISYKENVFSDTIELKGVSRDLGEAEYNLISGFKLMVNFHETGELNRVNISVKKGRKKENSDYKI